MSTPATSRSSGTPSWLHRLHASKGLSFPSHLHLDDLFLPPSSSSTSSPQLISSDAHPPKLLLHPPPPPSSSSNPPIPNPSPISSAISDLFVMPSPPPPPPPLKSLRKQSRPRAARSPPPPRPHQAPDKTKTKTKLKKRRRPERATVGEGDGVGERPTRTELTVIDTSTEGWKAAKLLLRRGAVWKVRNRKGLEADSGALVKRRRRAGTVSKLERDNEKEKGASLGNAHATCGDAIKESDDLIQTLKRPRCSGLDSGGKKFTNSPFANYK